MKLYKIDIKVIDRILITIVDNNKNNLPLPHKLKAQKISNKKELRRIPKLLEGAK